MDPFRQPADPEIAALVRAAQASARGRRRHGPSRRDVLGLAALGIGGGALAACAPPEPPTAGVAAVELPQDRSDTEKTVGWANWTAYLDMDDAGKTYPTLTAFEKQTGIKVSYTEDIDDNDTYFNKIAPQLRAKQDINRDIFTFTDWMANRIIREGLCQPLELIQMANAGNLLAPLREVSFDPGRQHSLTWQSGFAGIGYHKKKVGRELKSLEDLWADDLKGRISVLSEFRDTLGLIMQQQGVDPSGDFTREQFEAAIGELDKRVNDGYIRRIKGNSYLNDLKSGNAVAGIVWSGDLFILRAETEDEDWEFVIPESGGMLWSDNLMVPITSHHRRNAQRVMDYYYEPKVAAEVAAWVNYICPVEGAREEMEKIDPDLAESPFIFPGEDYIAEHDIVGFRALSAQEDADYSALWAKAVGN
ncbi:MAG: polyamine ABC transporter substrate-binding protein [Kytococcus sp.]|nr:polyamine ABC transporter substrate-binding protein [Kytococcus sp.]